MYQSHQQYQQKTEAPAGAFPPIQGFESAWHQPWSEPVRVRIDPKLKTALVVSGLFAPVLTDTQITNDIESRWHEPWSEPVRIRPRLNAGLNLFNSLPTPTQQVPGTLLEGWFSWLSEPVRHKPGLSVALQRFISTPERLLPVSNITITMAATEVNLDSAVFGVMISNKLASAKVSIKEIQAYTSGAASIIEG